MRPLAILLLVAAVACAREEEAADTTAAATTVSLADFAGTWEGDVKPADRDTVVARMQLRATSDSTGWTMDVTSPTSTTTTTSRVTAVGGDSVVLSSGPFPSVLRPGQQVTTHAIYHLRDGRLIGTTHATYTNGETVVLRTEATRR